MHTYKCDVSLRVYHPTIDPERISQELGISPGRKWVAGTPRATPAGQALEGVYEYSYWVVRMVPKAGQTLPEFLAAIIVKLEAHKGLLNEITGTGGRLQLYISFFVSKNAGEIMDWELLWKLAQLRLSLAIDIYPTTEESDGEDSTANRNVGA